MIIFQRKKKSPVTLQPQVKPKFAFFFFFLNFFFNFAKVKEELTSTKQSVKHEEFEMQFLEKMNVLEEKISKVLEQFNTKVTHSLQERDEWTEKLEESFQKV